MTVRLLRVCTSDLCRCPLAERLTWTGLAARVEHCLRRPLDVLAGPVARAAPR